ncbi:PAB-dependent poly(A)-specific ribonuclease subunit 3, partial [Ceratobasidium sp. 423]
MQTVGFYMIRPLRRSKHSPTCLTQASYEHTRPSKPTHSTINVFFPAFIIFLRAHTVYSTHPLAHTLQAQHLAPLTPPGQNDRSQQSSPSKSRTFSPARNFSPSPFDPGTPTSQFAGSPPFNSPTFASASTFGSPNAQPYNFPQSYSAYPFQNPASRANSPPPSALRPPPSASRLYRPIIGLVQLIHRGILPSVPVFFSNAFTGGQTRIGGPVQSTGVRINTAGLIDIMTYDGQLTPEIYLQEDLISIGSLLLQLVCGTSNLSQPTSPPTNQSPTTRRHNNANNNPISQQNLASAHALTRFSPLLRQVVVWLVTPAVGKVDVFKPIEHLFKEISPAIIGAEMGAMLDQSDMLESELSRELENGRLVRLLCKFGFINERPEFDHDPRWAETGDRYIIKLFRDHVFHQVDARGKPVLNLTHVFINLNKVRKSPVEAVNRNPRRRTRQDLGAGK